MTAPAPAIFAALIVARPTPPQPTTATVSPGVSLIALKIVPAPVVTAQPSSAARSSGMSLSMATQACSWINICSAKAERLSIWLTVSTSPSLPARVRRGALSAERRVSPPRHSAMRPVTQNSQCPQNALRQETT